MHKRIIIMYERLKPSNKIIGSNNKNINNDTK